MSNDQIAPLKCALYVDFDNIYLGLQNIDPAAAEQFATDPARWLDWFIQGMPASEGEGAASPQPRSALIRRCYLNPRTFHRYRPYFTRAAFSIIDCPPLTGKGKNSSDIHMVMDILDTLNHRTHFDEFIILSGDADFTPVLMRLRAHDRRTIVLTVGQAAEAYKAACDRVVSEEIFIEDALGLSAEPVTRNGHANGYMTGASGVAGAAGTAGVAGMPPGDMRRLLDGMARRLYEEAGANGEITATDLPRVYREFPEFRRNSNWLGYFSLRALTQELVRRRPELRITETDPWKVTVPVTLPASPPPSAAGDESGSASTTPDEPVSPPTLDLALQQRIVEQVRKFVSQADAPVLMAKVAHQVVTVLGSSVIESKWAGAGTFKALLQEVPDLRLEMATLPHPGYLYDPARHQPPNAKDDPTVSQWHEPLATFADRVSRVTGAPHLTPAEYTLLFQAISDELSRNRYNLTSTSKAVRDLCIERGRAISRANVSFVLRGITYTGHRFGKSPHGDTPHGDTPHILARAFRDDVIDLCNDAQIELSVEEFTLLDAWILGEERPEKEILGEERGEDPSAEAAT